MKEKRKFLSQRIPDVRLRRSEVRELANILKADEGSLAIESDTHIFETVDELLASLESVKHIHLERDKPYVSVSVGSQEVSVYASTDDLPSVGLVSRLVEFAKSHRVSKLCRFSWLPSLLGFLTGTVAWVTWAFAGSWRLLPVVLSFFGVSFFANLALESWRISRPARIRFRREKGTPVHWRGVTWDLVKIVLPVLVGVLGTLFVQWCRVTPPSIPQPPTAAAVSLAADAGTAR